MRTVRALAHRGYERVYGTRAFDHLPEAMRTQSLPRAELEALQLDKLRRLLRVAWDRSPFHHERMRAAGLRPDDVKRVSDLARLPPVGKPELRKALAEGRLLTEPARNLVRGQTGGSTGEPLVYYHSREALGRGRAMSLRALQWYGWRPGDRLLTLWGRRTNQPPLLVAAKATKDALLGHRFLEADRVTEADARRVLAFVDRYRPAVLDGYVSSLVQIATHGRSLGIRVRPPGAVTTTAEMLLPHERRLLSEYFGCEVYDVYGSSEVNSIAYECPTHSGLHLCMERVVLEKDEDGGALVTDLDNLAMPFIRYVNGDVVEPRPASCPCGREMPLLKGVQGRKSDLIHGVNGNRVFSEFFTHLMMGYDWIARFGVARFQVVQDAPDHLTWRLVAAARPAPEDEARLLRPLRDHLGDMRVDFEYVDDIPPGPSGKRRATMRLVQ